MPVLTGIITSGLALVGAGGIGGGALIIAPGTIAGLTAGTVALVESVVSVAVTVGASYGINALFGNKKSSSQRSDIPIKQALPARFIDIGRVKTSGAFVFFQAPSTQLCSVKVMTCTKIQEYEILFLDDFQSDASGLNGGGAISAWLGNAIVQARLGTDDQTALDAITPIGSWTVNHRLRGLACIGTVYLQGDKKTFSQRFPNGPPNTSAVIKGAMLPDPRDETHDLSDPSTWDYSDNWARAVLRFALDRDGWGLSPSDINVPLAKQACDDADETVATTVGTEPRYRAWGRYTTIDDRATTLKNMLSAGGGRLIEQPDGTLGLFAGKEHTPNVTITADMLLDVQLERYPDALSRVDAVKPRIVWEGASWQEQECPAVYSGESYYGAAPDIQDLTLPWCPSPYQAQRLAKAVLRQLRPDWQGTIKTNLNGLRCSGDPVVRIVYPELGIDAVFELISQPKLDIETMTVTLSVRSYAPDTWSMAPEEIGEMGTASGITSSYTAPDPENLEASVATLDVTVSWDTLTDEIAYDNEAQWRPHDADPSHAEDGWTATATVSSGTAMFTVLAPGFFDFRCRRVSSRGFLSAWAILHNIEVV